MKMYSDYTSLCNLRSSDYASPRKSIKTLATQTDHFSNISWLKFLLYSESLVINEDSKNIYTLLLNYVNDFNNLLNKKLTKRSLENVNTFKIPDIPNYSLLCDIGAEEKETSIRKINSEISLEDIKRKESRSQKVHASEKSMKPHEVLERMSNNNGQCTNLRAYKNDLAHKMSEIISAVNTPQTCHKNKRMVDNNGVRNICEDECIILSKYHDEGMETFIEYRMSVPQINHLLVNLRSIPLSHHFRWKIVK